MLRVFSDLRKSLPWRLPFWPFGGKSVYLPLEGQFASPSLFSPDDAANYTAVYSCVRLLSETIAGLPLKAYKIDRAERAEIWNHPISRLVDRSPNVYQTGFAWMTQMIRDVCHRGNGFSLIERDPDGAPMALWPVPPAAVTIRSDGRLLWYEVRLQGELSKHDPAEVLHFKMVSNDGIRGISVLSAARRNIDLGIEQEAAGLRHFPQDACPTGVITVPAKLSNEAASRLREAWDKVYAGRRRTAVLEEGMKFEPVGMSFDDSEWVKSRQLTGEDICRFFAIPPSMVGYSERSSYSSAESHWQAFLATTLTPWLRMIESELDRKLLDEGEELMHDARGLVRADTPARYSAYTAALQGGWMTVNEVRRLEGLPAIATGDELRTPAWLQTQGEGARQ